MWHYSFAQGHLLLRLIDSKLQVEILGGGACFQYYGLNRLSGSRTPTGQFSPAYLPPMTEVQFRQKFLRQPDQRLVQLLQVEGRLRRVSFGEIEINLGSARKRVSVQLR